MGWGLQLFSLQLSTQLHKMCVAHQHQYEDERCQKLGDSELLEGRTGYETHCWATHCCQKQRQKEYEKLRHVQLQPFTASVQSLISRIWRKVRWHSSPSSSILPRDAMHSADYAVARCPSVRPSCLSNADILSKRLNMSSNFFHLWVATPF